MNRSYAVGRLKPGAMNKLEAAYAAHLEARKRAGEILWYLFEGVTLKLAANTRLTPDFVVMTNSCELQLHECKGFMQDDANVKLKVAAAMFPFRMFLIRAKLKRDGGGFSIEEIGA